MNILPTASKENEENDPPPSLHHQREVGRHTKRNSMGSRSPKPKQQQPKSVLLSSSRRFPHANSPVRKAAAVNGLPKRGSASRQQQQAEEQRQNASGARGRHIHWRDDVPDGFDDISPTSYARNLDETLAEQGWSNEGNGVYLHHDNVSGNSPPHQHYQQNQAYIHHDGANSIDKSHFHSSSAVNSYSNGQRTGLQRRFNSTDSFRDSSDSINDYNNDNYLDVVAVSSPEKQKACRKLPKFKYSPQAKRKMVVFSMAIGLALVGYFVEIRQIMNATSRINGTPTTTTSGKDWLMSLPRSFSSSILGNGESLLGGKFDQGVEPIHHAAPALTMKSMEQERKRISSLNKSRAERRRMRTRPPSTYPTNPVPAASREESDGDGTSITETFEPPRLTLDLPAHRELVNNEVVHRSLQAVNEHNPKDEVPTSAASGKNRSNIRRRKLKKGSSYQGPMPICGPQAREASQLNPQNYPPPAHIGPKSRVVITGVLSQLGMELVLQLYEMCQVNFIVGIDSAYPNTRHERIDMIESRYKYIERRVPGFQRLTVPVFGIHPHPKVGEEVRFEEMNQGFDLVNRLKPTHIVHLAGLEEGRGEHTDYGDTTDASPFATPSAKSAMMRRFDSLLGMEQVFKSVAAGTQYQPQVVYVSSVEAGDQSGVTLKSSESTDSLPASVYGTSSLLKEVLASYYHSRHGVDSVGLRVPAIFGPFTRPGSLMNDLAERTIRNAAGHDVEGVPNYHHERDRYNLSSITARREGADSGAREQMAYVFDVASAIIASMQFKKNYESLEIDPNGPTIVNIGSKLTISMKELAAKMEEYLPPHDRATDSPSPSQETSSNAVAISQNGLSIYDTERNRDLLGWVHKTMLHEGTKTMLAWQILKAYPFGLPGSVPAHSAFQGILDDSLAALSYHSLPCVSGCRWGGGLCSSSPWDAVIETTQQLTQYCPYVLYTVDLRPELVQLEKESTPSQRKGWEDYFCKVAFVSSSSKLAINLYGYHIKSKAPMNEWNGKLKVKNWTVVAIPGTFYSMPEYERSLAKLSPTHLFNERVEKAMYVNHRRVILTTDQAMGVMQHLEMNARTAPEKKTIQDDYGENMDIWLPPHPHRHSVFFTNKYSFEEGYDTSNAKNLAKFVMTNAGIAETRDIRTQMQFYEQTAHLTRMNGQRSPNYQDFYQDNFFPFDFLRSSWLVHELKSEEGRILRCEMYEEHSLWGNNEMEDMSIAFVLAKRKVKMQMGTMADPQYAGPEEWYPLLVPREADDEDAITEGPVYLDYLEAAHKTATDSKGHEFYITFLPQKRKE